MRRGLVFLTVVFVVGVVIDLGAGKVPAGLGAGAPSTFTVGNGDVAGLIAAISAANASPGADTIDLAPGGSYTLTAVNSGTTSLPSTAGGTFAMGTNGLPIITDSLTINGNGATIERSSAGGTPEFRIMQIATAGSVTLSGLTIRNGKGSGNFQGGAIRNFQGTLNIAGSTITGNSGTFGGGIFNYRIGTVNVINSVVSNNISNDPSGGGTGGAIYNYQGVVNISDSMLSGNTARSAGAIFNYQGPMTIAMSEVSGNSAPNGTSGAITNYEGTLNVSDSRITGNAATFGGGLYNLGAATMTRSTVAGNTADLQGGGIFNFTNGTLSVVSSTIIGNSAHSPSAPTSGYGGGILNWMGSVAVIANSTISDNFTNFGGGGIRNTGTLTLTNVTVARNQSVQYGSGLLTDANGISTLGNTILAQNYLGRNCNFAFSGSMVSQGHNLSDDGTCSSVFTQPGDINNTPAGLDPAGAVNNGGTTLTIALLTGSAAIDAGDDAWCSAPPVSNQDQRGVARPFGARCDIGAYEAEPSDATPPVITCASPDGAWHPANVTLSCTASDDGSGLRDAADASFSLTTSVAAGIEDGNASTDSRTVCDNAGNCTEAGPIGGNKIDKLAPAVRCSAQDGTWHSANVAIACTASDTGAGLAAAGDSAFGLTTDVAAGVETANASTESRAVCDNTGNCTPAGPIGGNKVDRRAPAVSITTPTTATYTLQQAVASSYGCSDGGSGVSGCTGPVANGANIHTSSAGTHTFPVTATDAVGNTATSSVTYTVGYGVCVLFDQSKAHKAGSTIPIKLGLCDATGANVSSPSVAVLATSVYLVSTSAPGPLADSGNANPDYQFRFSDGSYIFNLSLTGFAQGTYALTFTAGSDPRTHVVQFQVK